MSEEASGRSEAEAAAGAEAGEQQAADGEKLAAELEALRRKATESWDKYLRASAEIDNLRRRAAREVENARKFGLEGLAQALLPVRDSLEAGLAAGDTVDVETLLEGKRATLRLLDEALRSAGIEEIDPRGEPFDPTRHEAITLQRAPEAEPNTVLQVIQKGYSIHERLLRPARVVVAAGD